jgi:DNA-binding ferritin-like protein
MIQVQSGIYNSTCSSTIELIITGDCVFVKTKERHWYLKGDAFKQG